MTHSIELMMIGAIIVACVVASVQFFKFWRLSRDRFFIWFGLAFAIFGIGYAIRALIGDRTDATYYVYVPRLVGFVLILYAIVDKNRKKP